MTENTKITLSDKELELVCNADWILTKHSIIQKVYRLFGDLAPLLEHTLAKEKEHLPLAIFNKPPKIARGENYLQLPYVMLDYPGNFSREDTFAIRTLFWWGNFFSINLQLSGRYKIDYVQNLLQQFNFLQQNGFWVCTGGSPWEHHFENSNFVEINGLTKDEFWAILCREPFVKISKKIPLQQWGEAPFFIATTFAAMIQLLKAG